MKESEFYRRKFFLNDLFVYYSDMYRDVQMVERGNQNEIEAVMKQIDTVLDWYNELRKEKENMLWTKKN